MSLKRAQHFMNHGIRDESLRNRCLACISKEELLKDLGFTEEEFEDALNMRLLNCQSYEETQYVHEVRLWFAML